MSALLDAWLQKVRFEDIEAAIEDLDGALEELAELARGDRHPGSKSALQAEIELETSRAEKAIAVLKRAFSELQDGAA